MRAKWAALRKKNVVSVVKGFRVEPIALLNFIALGIFHLVSQIGTYQVICYHTIGDNPILDCSKAAHDGGGRGGHHGGGRHGQGQSSLNDSAVLYESFDNALRQLDDFAAPVHAFDSMNETRVEKSNHTRGHRGGRGHGGLHNITVAPRASSHKPRQRGNGSNSHKNIMDTPEYQALENRLQQAAVRWQLVFELCHAIPALFTDTLLGALGDRHGRQANILIGLSGSIISVYTMTIMFTFRQAPLFILIISGLISGFTGYMSIIMISCFAYLADTVVDHELLTVRMTYFSLIMSVSGIISPQIGNGLMRVLTNAQVSLVSEAILVTTFFLTILIVRQRPPVLMRKIMLEKYIKEHGHSPPAGNEKFEKYRCNDEPNNNQNGACIGDNVQSVVGPKGKGFVAELKSIWKTFVELWKEVYSTYTRPRPGHARLYLLFASFVYFLHQAFEGGIRSSVFSLYVFKSPFHWGRAELSTYRSVNSALHLVGALIGVAIFKKFIRLSDTTVILFAMGTHVIECVLFAFAETTAGLYAAAATGTLTMLMAPCIKSFISQLVNPDEVGKSFTAFSIATTVARISSNIMYSNIYSATVGWFPGFAFLLAGGLELVCMALILWLHFDYHYDGSLTNCLKTNPCARLFRRKPVAVSNTFPPTTQYALKGQIQGDVKPEVTEILASDKV